MPTPSAMSNRMNELVTMNNLFSAKSITHMGIRGAFLTLFFVSLLVQCDSPEPINTSLFSVEIDVTDSLDQTVIFKVLNSCYILKNAKQLSRHLIYR